jgi:8-oxo-dGTP pyrophosphatase MutT (NUDIX family)
MCVRERGFGMTLQVGIAAAEAGARAQQVAALPWRRDGAGRRQVMLITSRETRRWIVPKGWPIEGLSDADSAAREAFEEAGIEGPVGRAPIGAFDYVKRTASGRGRPVEVLVFPLLVTAELDRWPERDQRARGWFHPHHAATLVTEAGLARLLLTLD